MALMLMGTGIANAWHASGYIYCDVNQNNQIDGEDDPLENVTVNIVNNNSSFVGTISTDANGYYYINLPDLPDTFTVTLDEATLPVPFSYVIPQGGEFVSTTTDNQPHFFHQWLIDSETCWEVGCWLTGGGVKFSTYTGTKLAEKGPKHNFGGNVFPSCDPNPGDGGQWNHIAHAEKLHFQGWTINTVDCGNVPGIEPGSESPVTPYNYIEFQGTGTLKGIKGNKVDYGNVFFFARAEDRNEPGSHGAKAGADIDRYFLHVFDSGGNTLLLVDEDDDPSTINPVPITGGNLQLHISSCDN
jgi:hypothetical protein